MVDKKYFVSKDASFCFTQNSERIQFPVSLEVNRNPRAELSLPFGKKSTTW